MRFPVIVDWLLRAVVVGAGLLVVAGFGGVLHPLGDSLAVFRIQLALVCALALIWTGWPRVWRWSGVAVLVAVILGTQPFQGVRGDAPLRIYQKNLSFRMQDTGPVVADIRAMRPDIITLQEVSQQLSPILTDLAASHPHQMRCAFHGVVGDVVVLSRWPIGETKCVQKSGFAAAKITTPEGPVWAVSLHLHWPYPFGQAAQVDRLLPMLAELDAPVVLGGDFNMVPWASTPRRIARVTKTRILRGPRSTLDRFLPLAPLPIDHILAPVPGQVQRRAPLGSDHHGVFATVGIAD